jgi:hypothetical protein
MAVPIRGHRTDVRESENKFNGIQLGNCRALAFNHGLITVLFQSVRNIAHEFEALTPCKKTEYLQKSKRMLTQVAAEKA